jgi:uncharacterized RDD family membrane protein YckC
VTSARTPPAEPQQWRGQRLGLPESGIGSIAPSGARIGAFAVDAVAAALVAALFVQLARHGQPTDPAARLPGYWSLVPFFLDYVVGSLVAGRTLGMYLFGLRLIRVDRDAAVGPVRIVARTVLLMLLVPAVVFDRDGRGMHDRLTETAVVRAVNRP